MEKKINKRNQDHILYFDYLRILATIAVIILHVAARNWYTASPISFEWKVFNVADSAVRWSVPIFVMISGALFLDNAKPLDVKRLYTRSIVRIVTAFLFWSAIYALDKMIAGADMKTVVMSFVDGNYHMWFLYMIVGLYIVAPVLRKITESKKITEYFLVAGIIFTFLIPRTINILKCIGMSQSITLANIAEKALSNMNFYLTLGYVFYYILGFYIAKYEWNILVRRVSYGLCILGGITMAVLTNWHSNKIGYASEEFYSYFSIGTLFMSVGIFLFAKYVLAKIKLPEQGLKIIRSISKCSFGIYLVHDLIIQKFDSWLNLNTMTFNPIVSIIVIVIGVFAISYLISAVFNHIPVLKKFVV